MTTPPHTQLVREVWAEVVDLDDLEADDDFFALGGDSITAASVARKVGLATGRHIPPRTLFEHPTFGAFLEYVGRRPGVASAVASRPNRGEHPLVSGQQRQWLLHQLHPHRTTYTVPTIVQLDGPLDRPALDSALAALVDRHEPLRTLVRDRDPEPMAHVLPPPVVPVETAKASEPTAIVDAFLRRPFALDTELPLRALLVRLTADRHWLVVAVDHIAIDGESQRILLDELGHLYSGRALPPLAATYGDIAQWQVGRAIRPAGRPDVLRGYRDRPLALEGPDPDLATGIGARHTRWLGPRLTTLVRACASERRTTVFVTLLAAFADIVARWSGSDDVCVGYPLSVREPEPARDLIGFFVETCVARLDVSDRPTYGTVIDRTHAAVVAATTEVTPFDVLAQAVAAANGDRTPLFRTWFNHLGAPPRPPELDGLSATVLDPPTPPALFDLNVYVVETDDDIRIDVVRDVAVCSGSAADELMAQYVGLLEHAVTAVDAPLRYRPPSTRTPDPTNALPESTAPTLARRLTAILRERSTATAVGSLTYAGLRTAVGDLAAAIRAAGMPRGSTIAVIARRDSNLAVAILGVWAAGGRLLLLDPAHPPPRLAAYVTAAGAGCLVTDSVLPSLDAAPMGLVRLVGGRSVVVRAAEDATGGARVGYVAFTSGSTGEPVGVIGTLEPIEHFLRWYSERCALGSDDRFALLAGLSHDPVFRDILLPLWNGATLCVPPADVARVPADLVNWLRDERVTVVHLTPPLARLLAAEPITLPDVRVMCLGGDALTDADLGPLASLAPHAELLNGYGTTETPQLVSLRRLTVGERPALGPSAPGSQLLVLDETGEICGVGETGRIVVRSRHLARLLSPGARGLTGDPMPGVGRFATGDLGRYQTDGSIAYLGRDDDVVNIHGYRAHPAETDRALVSDPHVTAAVTIARTGADGPELTSYVVTDGTTPTDLRARLRTLLPAHLIPAAIVPVDRLPLSANGKIDRLALSAIRSNPDAAPRVTSPDGALEGRLASILSGILGIETIDVTATFFDLGAASLHLLRLHSAIRREVDARMPLLALYESPSVRALAHRLTGAEVRPAGGTTPMPHPRGSREDERARRLAARRGVRTSGQE